MTHDYAKAKKVRVAGSNLPDRWLYTTMALALGMIIMAFFLGRSMQEADELVLAVEDEDIPSFELTAKQTEPEFDFYTVLPNAEVKALPRVAQAKPEPEPTPKAISAAKVEPTLPALKSSKLANKEVVAPKQASQIKQQDLEPGAPVYIQVASYTSMQEAQRLEAQLSLMSFNCQIRSVNIQDKRFHRVIIGPFETPNDLSSAQLALSEQKLSHGLLLKTPV